jgi:hypothetical protein
MKFAKKQSLAGHVVKRQNKNEKGLKFGQQIVKKKRRKDGMNRPFR